eukprot:s586_g21.t1
MPASSKRPVDPAAAASSLNGSNDVVEPGRATEPTLSQRFKALQITDDPPADNSLQEFGHMSLLELWNTKLGFGKTHTNKTFGTIWLKEPEYVQWFLDHHAANSQQWKHRRFKYFCECMVDRLELDPGAALALEKRHPSWQSLMDEVSIEYSPNMDPGPKYLQLWRLYYRSDFGLPGMADPFDMCTLMELVLTQGLRNLIQALPSSLPQARVESTHDEAGCVKLHFQGSEICLCFQPVMLRIRTDANEGVEKLNVMVPNKAWLEGPYKELPALVEGLSLIKPIK